MSMHIVLFSLMRAFRAQQCILGVVLGSLHFSYIFLVFHFCRAILTAGMFPTIAQQMASLHPFFSFQAYNDSIAPDWADTCWSGCYDCVAWHARHFTILLEWLTANARLPDCPATVTELLTRLQATRI
uniref:Uncharacterized protein n=1 Tax=Eutreptiella gymnastica TaxID=73025 RepID=A0A7S4G6P6_9EUGL